MFHCMHRAQYGLQWRRVRSLLLIPGKKLVSEAHWCGVEERGAGGGSSARINCAETSGRLAWLPSQPGWWKTLVSVWLWAPREEKNGGGKEWRIVTVQFLGCVVALRGGGRAGMSSEFRPFYLNRNFHSLQSTCAASKHRLTIAYHPIVACVSCPPWVTFA